MFFNEYKIRDSRENPLQSREFDAGAEIQGYDHLLGKVNDG